jgi:hypothetical protein
MMFRHGMTSAGIYHREATACRSVRVVVATRLVDSTSYPNAATQGTRCNEGGSGRREGFDLNSKENAWVMLLSFPSPERVAA